ncbi:MAG: DUF1800 domain-containing protein [Verrucomicrobiales bacterium]|nr:DUF1800 domain-containing protein [Verrucomicrobiota bacterium JB025]
MLAKADNHWTVEEAGHLLNRAGFGGSPGEVRRLHRLGRRGAVDWLLEPGERVDAFPVPKWAEQEAMTLAVKEIMEERQQLRMDERGLSGKAAEKAEEKRRAFQRERQQEQRKQAAEAQGWWFRRILLTRAPLREKMTLFWHDHFATSIRKVRVPGLMIRQNQLFREQALGDFRELTGEVMVDPAMMIYLDTPGSRKGKPNENFAREVMELFTLGEGHYSEEDIRQAARAFTGYRLNRLTGEVFHAKRQWDEGTKTVFGKSGNFTGEDVVRLIFEKPRAARFMAGKIWAFFADDNPAESTLDALAKTLGGSGYQMKPMLREMFLSEDFYSQRVMRGQIKCPVQFLIQLLKELEVERPPVGFPLLGEQQLGQVLFMPPNVAGWDWGQAWINTNTLLTRYNLAGFITKGTDDGLKPGKGQLGKGTMTGLVKRNMAKNWQGPDYGRIAPERLRGNPVALVDSLVFRFFQGPVADKARKSFIEYAKSKQDAEFTDKEVGELCHLMMSTPYYQLC